MLLKGVLATAITTTTTTATRPLRVAARLVKRVQPTPAASRTLPLTAATQPQPVPSCCSTSHAKCTTYRTVNYEDAPAYLQDNPFIRSGYRVNFAYLTCLVSLLRIHNQTCNVWSHLIGVPLFGALGVATWFTVAAADNYSTTTAMFMLFFAAAMLSMGSSSAYHLFQCHSEGAWLRLLQVDLSGMSILIAASCYPSLWVIFGNGCHGQTALFYLLAIGGLCSLGVLGPMWPPFNTPRYRLVRVVIYSGLSLSTLIPLIHIPLVFPLTTALPVIAHVAVALACFVAGAVFYATKFPEKRWPGKFDVWFHSHTNWHLCCLLGALAIYAMSMHVWHQRHLFLTCAAPLA